MTWDLEFVDKNSVYADELNNDIMNYATYDFSTKYLYHYIISKYYLSSEKYKSNLCLNKHEFTTSPNIYIKTGIKSISLTLDSYCNPISICLYGNTDILFHFKSLLSYSKNIKAFISEYGLLVNNPGYGYLDLNYLNSNTFILFNINEHLVHLVCSYHLISLLNYFNQSDICYLSNNLYVHYDEYLFKDLSNLYILKSLKLYYKDVYLVLDNSSLGIMLDNSIVDLNNFIHLLDEYNIKLCFYHNVSRRNKSLKSSELLSLDFVSKDYLSKFLGKNSIICEYKDSDSYLESLKQLFYIFTHI